VSGGEVLDTDPLVTEAGIDAGYTTEPGTLRAPDVSVGNVPDAPGWISGVPPLALEYADRGGEEDQLQTKIAELLEAGTRWVWVVRLVGPRRVEVYERDKPVSTLGPGQQLVAPGVLKNPVPVEALWDREAAHEVTLRNLLQRRGYESLEAVRQEGIEQGLERGIEQGLERGIEQGLEAGRTESRRKALGDLCEVLGIELGAERMKRISDAGASELESLIAHVKRERRWP
jgi:hypothetical protein